MLPTRFDHDCRTREAAAWYFHHRARQLLADGFVCQDARLTPLTHAGVEWGAMTVVHREERAYHSVYVYDGHRGQGHLRRFLVPFEGWIVTVPDCDIEAALTHLGVRFVVAGHHTTTPEYLRVEAFYGDRCAKRSGAALMNHIDEGIAVLRWLGAGESAERAFCIHPILQLNADLATADLSALTADPVVMALAMEYRSVANDYLSPMGDRAAADIRLSPLAAVNDMLRADKVQNYTDFLRYHDGTHPRSDALHRYFQAWLARLGIAEQCAALGSKLFVPRP